MLTEPTNIFTKDEELILIGEEILQWLESYTPPPLANNVNLVGRKFSENIFNVVAAIDYEYSPSVETIQQSMVTFFVKNTGLNSANVKLQISPKQNEVDYGYTDDSVTIKNVAPGEIVTIVPMIFSRYVRMAYKSDLGTSLEIIVQSHI
ncbi:DUF6385 domain-containing protein [Clostridium rectalis]|uniref:DUF6385 domain-containing protein n=1 Tax=Clostridium rectalis TaxID=2040295 RepID=UPI000F63284D|nr:DUF6385 domain-containing protein [Clostridium rectalis]